MAAAAGPSASSIIHHRRNQQAAEEQHTPHSADPPQPSMFHVAPHIRIIHRLIPERNSQDHRED